uniref:Uncharacterized protein n=1 Tax=Knipowitschia caucasica TaxID=637954 RepID=A0AAV2L002_KNICA
MTTMQKLLQLPVNAVNMVRTVQSQVQGHSQEEEVLSPDSGQHSWYNALPDELCHLRSAGGGGGGGVSAAGSGEEKSGLEDGGDGGGGVSQSQPLRYEWCTSQR